jgi:ribosomal protein S20
LAHSPRGWTGARTPSAIKRVRTAQRKRAINQPRRTAAKTLVSKALLAANDTSAGISGTPEEVQAAVERAVSALDKAAKIGAIHRNAADRRKSRLMIKVNAMLGGEGVAAPAKSARQIGKAAAAKEAKARIAASRAVKAKGAQTAAGKARAALARTSRAETGDAAAGSAGAATETAAPTPKAAAKPAASKTTATKATPARTTTAKAATAKSATAKASTPKASASAKTATAKTSTPKAAAKSLTTKTSAKKS